MSKGMLLLTVLFLLIVPAAAKSEPVFFPVDMYIDTGEEPLAVYQFELLFDNSVLSIVGIEGGEPHFGEPPYYDPEGMNGGRIIIAAFTTEPNPPRGRVRVATLHVMAEGRGYARPEGRLILTAGPGGERFEAALDFSIRDGGDNE